MDTDEEREGKHLHGRFSPSMVMEGDYKNLDSRGDFYRFGIYYDIWRNRILSSACHWTTTSVGSGGGGNIRRIGCKQGNRFTVLNQRHVSTRYVHIPIA